MDRGWVKNYRKIEDWEWYKEPTTAHLFQHLVRRANREDGRWRGIDIPKGCLVTSIRHLAAQTGLSFQQVRTSLKHLVSSGDITQSVTHKYTLIKVENYALYQGDNTQNNTLDNTEPTQSQHSGNTVVTLNKNIRSKELKNKEDIYIAPTSNEAEPVIAEIIDYLNKRTGKHFKTNVDKTKRYIKARIKEGFDIEDFKKVIEIKCRTWMGTDMEKYLRPETLFGTKFEGYLNEKIIDRKEDLPF